MQLGFINNSSQIAAARAAANHNIRDAITDKTGGVSFYLKLKELKEQLDKDDSAFDKLKTALERVYQRFIKNGRAVYSVACDTDSFEKLKTLPLPMQANLADSLGCAESPLLSGNVALSAPCDIVFNGFSFNADDDISSGRLLLAKKILSLEYLWQKIRVENGAYGCGATPNAAKRLDMWSYRDPQIRTTLDTFEKAAEYLSALKLSDRAVEDYIISVVRGLDNPQLPRTAAYIASLFTLVGKSDDALQQERDELLSATLGDINDIGKALEKSVNSASYCTVGSAENIERNSDLYDEVLKV